MTTRMSLETEYWLHVLTMDRRIVFAFMITALVCIAVMTGCGRKTEAWGVMDEAERIIESMPDSSLALLYDIDRDNLGCDEERARYALLMSMALDKNYVDTTTFDVLQPAIDYYLKHGDPDEKLRTLYYRGRIYENGGNDGDAMTSYIEALELDGITDSLVLARTLISQGVLYQKQYKIDEYAENNIRAARLYNSADKPLSEMRCYARALNGYTCLHAKFKADSLAAICCALAGEYPATKVEMLTAYLAYLVDYGTDEDILQLLDDIKESGYIEGADIHLARAYAKIGNHKAALSYIENVDMEPLENDSSRYYANKSDILERSGDYVGALEAYKRYIYCAERIHVDMFSNEVLFSEKKHQMEISKLMEVGKRDKIIRISLYIVLSLCVVVGYIGYRYYKGRNRRMKTEQENLKLKLEQETLRHENERTELELTNLRLEKIELESERYNLKELLQEQKDLAEPISAVIKERLDLLNSLIAKEITNNESYAKSYRVWLENMRKDKTEFMDSTRLAFAASHPAFMDYLVSHGLTDDEIRYVCLYAIGLRGKDVGEYLQLKSHYHISSAIRKKLGIDEHATNISIYIRHLMDKPG